jgi:hypothetical protein
VTTRWASLVSLGACGLLLAGIVQASRAHPAFVSSHPFNLLWLVFAAALATATLLAGRAAVAPRLVAPFVGFGVIGCLAAHLVQGIAHPLLASAFDPSRAGAAESLLLGFADAAFQTSIKWGAIAWLLRRSRATARRDALAVGLAVGLGFAWAELATAGQRLIVAETPIVPPALLSLWERTCWSGFHVFSGGMIAVAVVQGWIAWVEVAVVLHAALAAIATPRRIGESAPGDALGATLVTAVAVATWLLWLRAKEEIRRSGGPPS